jgi:hypothetical protein
MGMKRCMKKGLPENDWVAIMPSSTADVMPVARMFFILLKMEILLSLSSGYVSATGLYVP